MNTGFNTGNASQTTEKRYLLTLEANSNYPLLFDGIYIGLCHLDIKQCPQITAICKVHASYTYFCKKAPERKQTKLLSHKVAYSEVKITHEFFTGNANRGKHFIISENIQPLLTS